MVEERTWHEIIESQLRECPICAGTVAIDVRNIDDGEDGFGLPFDGEQNVCTGKMWRIKCDCCGCSLYGKNWHKLIKKWNNRQAERRSRDDVRKLDGQVALWREKCKELDSRLKALEAMR